jgi:hypothetical protein
MSQSTNPVSNLGNELSLSSASIETNDSVDLPLNPAGYEVGNILFQSLLVAGERYINSGRARPGTDEAHFEELFKKLTPEKQAPIMRRYFANQAKLEPKERVKVLGDLADLKPESPLTLDVTAAKLFESPLYLSYLTPIASFRSLLSKKRPPQLTVTPTANQAAASNRLTLRLEHLIVEEAQDDYWIWWPFVGKTVYNTVDEVSLQIVSIDENGDVGKSSFDLGSIKEGQKKTFNNLILQNFNLYEGTQFPKQYTAFIYAVEKDWGGANAFLEKAATWAKDKIKKELIARGLDYVGGIFGVNLPKDVLDFIANAIQGLVHKLIDWIKGLFGDDVLGCNSRTAIINSYTATWNGTGTKQSKSWDCVFAGEGGRWRTRMHWRLES